MDEIVLMHYRMPLKKWDEETGDGPNKNMDILFQIKVLFKKYLPGAKAKFVLRITYEIRF